MKKFGVASVVTIMIGIMFAFTSCEQSTSTELEESFAQVKQVTAIPGGQNTSMDLQNGHNQDSYFTVRLSDGISREAWCVEWNEPSISGPQDGVDLYTTQGREEWKELNYFMSIKNELRAQDPELTFREIQVVIWSLIDNPSFDVDKISEYENIDPSIYKDGQVLFDVEKVKGILSLVNDHFSTQLKSNNSFTTSATASSGVTFIKNDGQTVIVGGETAFAVKTDGNDVVNGAYSTCFDEEIIADVSFPKWGWTNIINANSGEITFDIYAGAGKCDLTKGTKVGEVTVEYTGGTFTANIEMTEISPFTDQLYTMTTTQLYVGNDPYPTNGGDYTVAPGQFGNIHDNLAHVTTDSYTITDLSGDIYFILHADVNGFAIEE